jgi:hypothetical protein
MKYEIPFENKYLMKILQVFPDARITSDAGSSLMIAIQLEILDILLAVFICH